jgi:hypothetical protein
VKPSLAFLLLVIAGIFQATVTRVTSAASMPPDSRTVENADQNAMSAAPESTVNIPGPLRSFLRMGGISQKVSPPEVLPRLTHNLVLMGYELGQATEYLILLRRYVTQAKELSGLATHEGNIRISNCTEAESLLHILGYKAKGECGHSGMSLVTADPERAFLTIDSGFPLLELEQALQHGTPFVYGYTGSRVPMLFSPADWRGLNPKKREGSTDFLESLLYEPDLARLYWALSRIEPATRDVLKKDIGLARLLPLAPALDLYGSQICVRDGSVVVPGGRSAEKEWQDMAGVSPRAPAQFIPELLTKDHGWLAAYYDTLARASLSQQEHFAARERIKRYFEAFRSPASSTDAWARIAYRPAPALMVLVTRLQWDANGDPYVPGGLQVWSFILRDRTDSKFIRNSNKQSSGWRHPDQLAEAMFAFARQEADAGPLQAYLCLSELDHRRAPGRRLSAQTVFLLAKKYEEFSDQYMIFSEFPDLDEESIARFINTAEALNKISDHTLRGNAMGVFQANVGLWQILARQGQIDRAQVNPSWMGVIKPFADISTSAQLVTAGRNSVQQLFRATTGKAGGSQDELIELLAGAHQTTPEAQQIHATIANGIRSVLDDQRLVSIDTLFALDDGLKNTEGGVTGNKDQLVALAGELREFEMPRPIFTNSERSEWAAGTYNNRHTDMQMRTDLVKVIKSNPSTKQLEAARGQLATFLRDSLVGMNYAYYEPPGSQVLHNNPLFVRSHDFSGETVVGIERLWGAPHLYGEGSPAGGGAHLVGSLADFPYVLAEVEQDFIAPHYVQALIWKQVVPGLLSNAIVPRWWNVSQKELHAVALYQRAGEELLTESLGEEDLRGKVTAVLSDRMSPERRAWLDTTLRTGKTSELLEGITPADSFYLTTEFRKQFPTELERASGAARELSLLYNEDPKEVNWERLSRDFGVTHPVFTQTYGREFINVKPFPPLGGTYNRLMAECWDSGNLYWARLADEMGYSPVLMNRIVPELTRVMVERIFASEIEDWPATLRALRETGDEVRQGKISLQVGVAENRN